MVNKKQLAILVHSPEAWNKWRSENHLLSVELPNAVLHHANLSEANLTGANFSGADLSHANLSSAKLDEADLIGADLSGANLRQADLSGAELNGASLSRANLTRANLEETNLIGADLSGADLSGADLSRASLRKANFSGAILTYKSIRDSNLSQTILSKELLHALVADSVSEEVVGSTTPLIRGNVVLQRSSRYTELHEFETGRFFTQINLVEPDISLEKGETVSRRVTDLLETYGFLVEAVAPSEHGGYYVEAIVRFIKKIERVFASNTESTINTDLTNAMNRMSEPLKDIKNAVVCVGDLIAVKVTGAGSTDFLAAEMPTSLKAEVNNKPQGLRDPARIYGYLEPQEKPGS